MDRVGIEPNRVSIATHRANGVIHCVRIGIHHANSAIDRIRIHTCIAHIASESDHIETDGSGNETRR
jgi:hypothetical protein